MIVNNIFTQFKNNVFIETGSFMGDGIQKAIDAGFKKIYSIELSDKYAGICEQRFRGNPKVKIVRGDSAFVLQDILKDINEPITFWLDGHHSCDDTALGAYWAPLIQELEQIKNHHIKNHTILIDDMRCWQEVNEVHGFVADDLRTKVKEINSGYDFSYIDGLHTQDIMACTVKNKVGLLCIATGKYDQYIPPLYTSVKKYFFTKDEVTMFVFTDQEIPEEEGIVKIQQEHLGWPGATLKRYHIFDNNKEVLSKMDYLFYCDADMRFNAPVGREILPTPENNNLVGTEHPGFYGGRRGTYDENPTSKAYVGPSEGKIYFAGGFNGGTSQEFLKMCAHIKTNIDEDLKKNYIALWHDESHMNRYFIDNPPKMLNPGHCYPESWLLPFERKLLALDKNHAAVRA